MDENIKKPSYSEMLNQTAVSSPVSAPAQPTAQNAPSYSDIAKSMGQTEPTQPTTPTYSEIAAQTATYIDNNGNPQTGTVVPTAEQQAQAAAESQQAQATAEATQAQADETKQNISYLEQMRQEYEKMYNAAMDANNKAAAANIEQVLSQIDQSKQQLTESYKATNRQLYRDYMEVLRTTPQKLAQMGYSGGMTESSRLGIDTNYQEALAENERARLASAAQLDAQGAQSTYSANATAAEANANAYQQYQTNLINLLAQEQTDKQQRAEVLASIGDFTGYSDIGYTQDEIDAMTLMWLKQNPGMKDTWIKSHPEDAKRLGIVSSGSSRRSGGGGGGGGSGSEGGGEGKTITIPWSEYVGAGVQPKSELIQHVKEVMKDPARYVVQNRLL